MVLCIGLAIFPWVAGGIKAISHYVEVMIFVGIYGLITMGLNLLLGYAGQISLGHAAFYGLGAYASAVLTTTFGWNPWAALFAGVVLTSLVALAIGVPSLRLKGHYLAMATLGFGVIVFIVFSEWIGMTRGPSGFSDIPGISILGFALDNEVKYYYFVWTVVILSLVFSLNVVHSRIGRALRSIHESEAASNAMGVNTSRYKIQIFMLSAVLASIAGSLYSHYVRFVSPSSFDLFFSIKLLMMVVIGGMGNIWGALLGTFLITYLSNEWLYAFGEGDVLVYGAVLLLVSMFFSRGLIALPRMCRELFRKRREQVLERARP